MREASAASWGCSPHPSLRTKTMTTTTNYEYDDDDYDYDDANVLLLLFLLHFSLLHLQQRAKRRAASSEERAKRRAASSEERATRNFSEIPKIWGTPIFEGLEFLGGPFFFF